MERMGRIRDRAYSLLSVSDLKVLEQMKLFEDNIRQYEFGHAEAVIKDIMNSTGNSVLDKQFIIRAENLVNFYQKRISADEYLNDFEKAIRLTIPKYGTISLANWPLSYNEAVLLINISVAYSEKKDLNMAINIIKDAYSAVKQSYMEEQQRAIMQVTIANNLSKWYGLIGNHEEAIITANEGVRICKKYKIGNVLPHLIYGIAWNQEQLIALDVLPYNKKDCINNLKKAYYLASAMRLSYVEQFIKEHIIQNYDTVIE
jgi:hypothetical protein